MPFTPSHAVVALPFLRTPLVPAAIAVGAMTPDLPLFLRGVVPSYGTTHSPEWLPLTVLLALALLLLWRCVLRPATPALIPVWVAARLPVEWEARPRDGFRETFATRANPQRPSLLGVALVLASLTVGVASHLLWDAFTHEGRWGVALIPALEQAWGPMSGMKWAQHGSSVIGLAILAIWGARWLVTHGAHEVTTTVGGGVRWTWWVSLPVILVSAWVAGLIVFGPLTPDFTIAHLAYRVLPVGCAMWGALTVALAVVIVVAGRTPARHARRSRPV